MRVANQPSTSVIFCHIIIVVLKPKSKLPHLVWSSDNQCCPLTDGFCADFVVDNTETLYTLFSVLKFDARRKRAMYIQPISCLKQFFSETT